MSWRINTLYSEGGKELSEELILFNNLENETEHKNNEQSNRERK